MKNKKISVIIAAGLILLVGISFWYAREKNSPQVDGAENGPVLFYRDDCVHCANVEKYLEDNKINERIKIDRRKVKNDTENQKNLLGKAKICKLDANSIGVPFLWTGKECLMGDQPIIDYFKVQTNAK